MKIFRNSAAIERKNSDPDGAITIARTLLEAVCRKILSDLQVPIKENPELPQLYRVVSKELNLAPDLHSEQLFKQTLGSCTQIVEGIGAIRNNHGDSHAIKPGKFRPSARHAALAINLTFSVTTFLLATAQSALLKKRQP